MANYNTNFGSGEGSDFYVSYAERQILEQYGDTVSVESKVKSLNKFGKNLVVGTSATTVMTLAGSELHETYATTNAIDTVSSSSTSDTTQTLTVEGHTVSGTGTDAQFTFVTQTIAVTGQSKATLSTPLARASRVYVSGGSTNLVGNIYVYEDGNITSGVPDTASTVHVMIPAGKNQSFKAATTFSNTDYFLLSSIEGAINKKTAGFAELELQVRLPGRVFRSQFPFTVASAGSTSFQDQFRPFIIIPKNADVRVVATADSASTPVSAEFNGLLAEVVG